MNSDTLSVPQPGTVVAGVDGSVSARTAALWAAGEARRSGRTPRLVHGASLDHLLRLAPAGAEHRLREAGRVCLAEARDAVHERHPALTVAGQLSRKGPVAALLENARAPGDSIVAGSRGLGGFGSR